MAQVGRIVKTAVITGGAGGLGRALSAKLLDRGWRIYLLDIDVSGVETTDRLYAIQVDLTKDDQLITASEKVLNVSPALDLVIYNAGVSHIAYFGEATDAAHRRLFEINYFSAVAMARAFQSAVRAAKGTHLAISSVAGFTPLHRRTAYAASKHAMQGFFTSLRSEESPYGVHTIIAAPSFVGTNLGADGKTADGMVRPGSATDGLDYMMPDAAAEIIIRGVERRRSFIPVGRIARLAWLVNRLSPSLFEWLMRRNIAVGSETKPE